MGQWPPSHPFPRQIPVFSLAFLLHSSVPRHRWPGMRLPLQMLIFWPAVSTTPGIISLQSPSALSLLGGTEFKGRELTGREMQESAWPCSFRVFLGQGDAGSILWVPAPPGPTFSTPRSWIFLAFFLFSKNRDKIKKSFLGNGGNEVSWRESWCLMLPSLSTGNNPAQGCGLSCFSQNFGAMAHPCPLSH